MSQALLDTLTQSSSKNEPQWLVIRRQEAAQRWLKQGFPTTKNEDWKYTNLRALSNKTLQSQPAASLQLDLGDSIADGRLVLVNGEWNAELSDDLCGVNGLTVRNLQAAMTDDVALADVLDAAMPEQANPLAELNRATFGAGLYLQADQGINTDDGTPYVLELVLVHQGENAVATPRVLIQLAENARLTVIERYVSDTDSSGLNLTATEAVLAENSVLEHCLLVDLNSASSHIGGTWANIAAGAQFLGRSVSVGGQLIRNELKTHLNGEGAHADALGLFVGNKRQHIDNHTTMHHNSPNCTSNEIYKGILDDAARGVFHGRIVVAKDAQQTAAEQQNANMLLSRKAEIDTKPQLEIYADDVKCSHGATVGELDQNQLFYLRSRGIAKQQAEQLLIYAFAADVLENIGSERLKEQLKTTLADKLLPDVVSGAIAETV